ncbi:MAG: hypothetical protein ABGY11_15255 [Candidatus Thioglobus sp.]|jgi:hypothetical protein
MSHKTYLSITNDILGELNEVQLTSSNFLTAKGLQKFVKDAINRAYFDIANENPEFPWLATTTTNATEYGNNFVDSVIGQRWHLLKKHSSGAHGTAKDFGRIDWDNFYLTTEEVGTCSLLGVCSDSTYTTASTCVSADKVWTDYDESTTCVSPNTWTATHTSPYERETLKFIAVDTWKKHFRESDDSAKDTGVYGKPTKIIMSPCGRKFGLSPLPDKAYRIYFYAWEQLTELTANDDEVKYPEQWTAVMMARARYYIWQFKENIQLSTLALDEYKKGIKLMKAYTGKPQPSTMMDDRIKFV